MKQTAYLNKQELQHLPIDELLEARVNFGTQGVSQWLEAYQIKQRSWVMPQLYARVANWKKTPDCLDYVRINTKDPLDKLIYILATHPNRSELLQVQVKTPKYSALVPLLLAPHKEYTKTPYSYWQNIHVALDSRQQLILQDSEAYEACCNLGSETLQEILAEGLVFRSGKKMGQQRSPRTTWKITVTHAPDCVKSLSAFSQAMLFQIWLAHPKNRLPTMILDPRNWDQIPEPLIGTWDDKAADTTAKSMTLNSLPWEW